jgi:hypothetical protein
LAHHRGGDSEQLEEEFHYLAEINQSQVESPISMQANTTLCNPGTCSHSCLVNLKGFPTDCAPERNRPTLTSTAAQSTQQLVLTIDQQAMIESKRVEALKRRQQTLQQKLFNPYAK